MPKDTVLVFDTETTGMVDFKKDETYEGQPHLVQFAGILFNNKRPVKVISIILNQGFESHEKAIAAHGITPALAEEFGTENLVSVLKWFELSVHLAETVVAHNASFDKMVMLSEMYRKGMAFPKTLENKIYDTMLIGTELCKLKKSTFRKGYKWPSLQELHTHLFGEGFEDAHDALVDVQATARCYFEMTKENK